MTTSDFSDCLREVLNLWGWQPYGLDASVAMEFLFKSALIMVGGWKLVHLIPKRKPKEVIVNDDLKESSLSPTASIILAALKESNPMYYYEKVRALCGPGFYFEFSKPGPGMGVICKALADPKFDPTQLGVVVDGTDLAVLLDAGEYKLICDEAQSVTKKLIEKTRASTNARIAAKIAATRYNSSSPIS